MFCLLRRTAGSGIRLAVAVTEAQYRDSPFLAEPAAGEGHIWTVGTVPVIAGKGQASAGDNIADSKGQVRDRFSASISVCDGPRFGGGTVLLVADGRGGFSRGSVSGCNGGSSSGGAALEVPLDVGGWAVHGAGSFQESKAAMSPNAQADRSIIQSPLHHGFRCTMTESATLAVKDLRRRLILVPRADHRLRSARHW